MVEFHWVKEKSGMVVNEFLLNGAFEAFHMSIHLGCPWVCVIVREVKIFQLLIEVLLELRTIVGQHKLHLEWKCNTTKVKELFGGKRCVRGCAPCKGKASVDVLEGDYVPPASVYEAFYGIKSDDMPRVRNLQMFRFSQDFLAIHLFGLAEMRHLLRELS